MTDSQLFHLEAKRTVFCGVVRLRLGLRLSDSILVTSNSLLVYLLKKHTLKTANNDNRYQLAKRDNWLVTSD